MTKDEALRLALEALSTSMYPQPRQLNAIAAIKAALEAKDEPVAYINVEQRKLEWAKYMSWDTPTVVNLPKIPLYTTPPQRTWVGLSDEDKQDWIKCMPWPPEPAHLMVLIEGVELELKELNR